MKKGYRDITTYGIIGNCETCALVGIDGSVDWLCLPGLESPSVFGALLDDEKGGSFAIFPRDAYESMNSYLGTTNILQTLFTTATGNARLTDFMPVKQCTEGGGHRTLLRKVEGTKGITTLRVLVRPRFDYGRDGAAIRVAEHGLLMEGRQGSLFLQSPPGFRWSARGDAAEGELTVRQGQVVWFVLSCGERRLLDDDACGSLERKVHGFWQNWVNTYLTLRGRFDEQWRDVVIRSGLTLKLLLNPETGAIAAAATTSLPEVVGGVRNWDYRFAWIRDSSFTIQALYHLGDINEVHGYLSWIEHIIGKGKDPSKLHVLYGLHDQTDLHEVNFDHLDGYKGSRPVRIGNGATDQHQLDIYGELVNAIYEISRYGASVSKETWSIIREIVNHVCRVWEMPDHGIWEIRGKPRHFVYSKLMCWVAIDRGIRIACTQRYDAPLGDWQATAGKVRAAILEQGFDAKQNSFVQAFGSPALDATALLIPGMGFLPYDDPRVQGTIEAVRRRLSAGNGLIYRYRNDDGLPGREGAFILASFWLVKALALSRRVGEAEEVLLNVLRYVSPLGLLSEEVDPGTGSLLGNFPQAFSHIGLINASLYLGMAKGKTHAGPSPSGMGQKAAAGSGG